MADNLQMNPKQLQEIKRKWNQRLKKKGSRNLNNRNESDLEKLADQGQHRKENNDQSDRLIDKTDEAKKRAWNQRTQSAGAPLPALGPAGRYGDEYSKQQQEQPQPGGEPGAPRPDRGDKASKLEDKDTVDQKDQGRIARQINKIKQNFRRKKAEREKAEKQKKPAGQAGKMGCITFVALFGLGALKDFIDFLDFGLTGSITNVIVIMAFVLISIMSGSSVKEFASKRKYLIGLGATMEFIPVLSMLPIWALSVIWMKLETSGFTPKQIKALSSAAQKKISSMKKK